MVANVRRVVTSAASSHKQRNAAGNEAAGGYVVVDTRHTANWNLQIVEELLAASNGAPGVSSLTVIADLRPIAVEVENV